MQKELSEGCERDLICLPQFGVPKGMAPGGFDRVDRGLKQKQS
jgi:hypothetical protein